MSHPDGFEFKIRPAGAGWSWATYDNSGEKLVGGETPTRAEAAACVIRSIATRAGTEEERQAPRTAEERAAER